MGGPLTPLDVARRRVIERFDLGMGKGVIVANGKTFTVAFDDLLDLVQAVEMIMLKLTGKVLGPKHRANIVHRDRLKLDAICGGDYSLYDGHAGSAPVEPFTPCDVTGQMIRAHYLSVTIGVNRWANWFGRLDELVKCLYVIVGEAQGEEYKPRPAIFLSSASHERAVILATAQPASTVVAQPGHA